ncbi:MAG: PAS domain S-box protein [Deltaproteobacteria bacterium]|nr:PAS domain S-box protein [Deltaproteobacteria bacterium]
MDESQEEKKELDILLAAVENTNEAFVTIDEDHKVLFFNRTAERIFGYTRDEVLGRDLDVIMSPTCSRDHHGAIDRYIRTGRPTRIGHESELLATRKGGETFPASISFSVSRQGGKTYFTGLVRDLTETKALQEQVIRSERLAALGQVIAEITHEIKNPMMMIGGFAHQLLKQTRDRKAQEKLNIIVQEVARLEKLLRDLREFYLPPRLNRQEVDINGLLREIYELSLNQCKKKKIVLEVDTEEGETRALADRDRIKQVILNLVNNAIDAMENGGKLSLQSKRSGGKVLVTVRDTGCGIPRPEQGKVFSPFFTSKEHGTGLGLSISKRIIEEHRGSSLTMESEEGKGTSFQITMPLSEGHSKE